MIPTTLRRISGRNTIPVLKFFLHGQQSNRKRVMISLLALAAGTWSVAADSASRADTFLQGIPKDSRPFRNHPTEGEISVSPDSGEIEADAVFSVTFPNDMVDADKIDKPDAISPVVVWPPLEAKFTWRSPTEGEWTVVGPRIPGQTYRLRLREGLTDLSGKPLPVKTWGMELKSPPLMVSCEYGERDQLPAKPVVPLEFSVPIRLDGSPNGIWFQNRATRKRFPAEVLVRDSGQSASGELPAPDKIRVTPREPLPGGGYYDIVVENVFDAYAGQPLPYPHVFQLGRTRPLKVDFVAARNWPTDRPFIEVKFRSYLAGGELPQDAVTVVPSVAKLRCTVQGESMIVDGDFDTKTHYQVTISDKVRSEQGFGMEAPSVWGATFQPKDPQIIFPPGEFRQRAALGLRLAFVQCHTGPVMWRLASIPPDKLAAVKEKAGKDKKVLVIDELGLPVVGRGEFPGLEGDREEVRKVEFQPDRQLAGPYLFEASTQTKDGGVVENCSVVWFGEVALTQKETPSTLVVRAASMTNGQPLPNVTIKLLTREMMEVGSAVTDGSGQVTFSKSIADAATYFQTDCGGVTGLWPSATEGRFDSGAQLQAALPAYPGRILTDRPLYRPGQELKIQGMVRKRSKDALAVPAGATVQWEIVKAWQSDVLASGNATVTPSGGWNAEWTTPETGALGEYCVRAKIGASKAGEDASFRIEEFRNPPFSVVCEEEASDKPGVSAMNVRSRYFHGAPNVGSRVKWKATWLSDHGEDFYNREDHGGFNEVDLYSENAKAPVFEVSKEGEGVLDGNGQVIIRCDAPFPDPGNRARATVNWQVDITGPDGQTITGGASCTVVMNDNTLGIKPDGEPASGKLVFDLRTQPRVDGVRIPDTADVRLFHVSAKTAKEKLAPFIYRYRNFNAFVEVGRKEVASNGKVAFDVKDPGRYVVVASVAGGMPVSEESIVSGPGESEVPVKSDESLKVVPVAEVSAVGEPAAFHVLSPTSGVAWVTVETDRILYSQTVSIPGNTTRIEIPIKPEYVPNAFVSVYMIRPGGGKDLPGEMYGYARIGVTDASKELTVKAQTGQPNYEPRETVQGSVTVTCGGKPVPGAEVTVYAVDDSVLTLGGWKLPVLSGDFYPEKTFNVVTHAALRGLVGGFKPESLTQKGFVVGDGGDDVFGKVEFTRKDFKPLVFWRPAMVTGADGKVNFECHAPDNLTRFRVIALAQTAANQFGSDSDTFTVSKKMLIEPALPRFLREGDLIDLRAVARQSIGNDERLTVRCTTDLELKDNPLQVVSAHKDAPAVVQFAARVPSGVSTANIRFDVASKSDIRANDSVSLTLPVLPRTIAVRESKTGSWRGNEFSAGQNIPEVWKGCAGRFDLTLSTSSWLTRLMGIPSVLDYPHGCLEQKSSKILVYTAMAELLKWLPTDKSRNEHYRHTILESFKEFEESLLSDGLLPYWPMGTNGNVFVTIQCARAVAQAQVAGLDVPARLAAALPAALRKIVDRAVPASPTLRAFALESLAATGSATTLRSAADDLFLERDRMTNEGRAMLAMAYHAMKLAPEKQAAIVKLLPTTFETVVFDPVTFSSRRRTETLCLLAQYVVSSGGAKKAYADKLMKLMEGPDTLSTQENLWLLVAARELISNEPAPPIAGSLAPRPDAVSPNLTSAGWRQRLISLAADLTVGGMGKDSSGTYVLAADRFLKPDETRSVQNGMRIDRIVKNLTDPTRTGSGQAPFQMGDQVLISYRFKLAQPLSYLVIEDALPSGIEVVNPNLDLFSSLYPSDDLKNPAALSHSEMHDSKTDLYFDHLETGLSSYAVLARVTSAGVFCWPAAQIYPMYESQYYSRTAPSDCCSKP